MKLTRAQRCQKSRRLQEALGPRFNVMYDVCESGYTELYLVLKNGSKELYKRIKNDTFDNTIDVNDMLPSQGMLSYYINRGMV